MNTRAGSGSRRHAVAGAFVFLLLGVFALFSTLLVLLSAQLYRGIVEQVEENNAHRVLYHYVMNAVRANDATDAIDVQERNGTDMLVFSVQADGERYETLVYCHNGSLRELFVQAGQEFEPDYGEIICAAQAFEPSLNGGLLQMRITDSQGQTENVHIALRTSAEKEAQP